MMHNYASLLCLVDLFVCHFKLLSHGFLPVLIRTNRPNDTRHVELLGAKFATLAEHFDQSGVFADAATF